MYRVVSANEAANELLGRPCRPGHPALRHRARPSPACWSCTAATARDTVRGRPARPPADAPCSAGPASPCSSTSTGWTTSQDALRRRVGRHRTRAARPRPAVITGLVDALLERWRPDLDEAERRRLLDAIAHQAGLLDTVAGDLLTQAQAQHGNLRIETADVDPAEILRSQGEELESVAVEVEDARTVVADPRRLEQMVHNLVSNARKYGRAPYTLRVRTAADPAYVCIDVSDRGPGRPRGVPRPAVRRVHPRRGHHRRGRRPRPVRRAGARRGPGRDPSTTPTTPDGGAVFTITLPAADTPA